MNRGILLGVFLIAGWLAAAKAAEGRKRVLLVHSYGSGAAASQSVAFETELTKRMGSEKVYVDEVYLDHARYPETDMEEAFVDYLEKRVAKWKPDLVVPLVSPACVFVARHRERLFPSTPILYAGMDKRRLPAGALEKNAAFVGNRLDLPGFAEDMLKLAPETTNIVCVIGASPVERYWTAEFLNEFARFTNRVSFTWLNDLPFDQTLERVKRLPPRSFVFVILMLRDAAGVAHDSEDVLKQIREAANAPVNSIFEHQLGLGIVGGRLYSSQAEGLEAARIAVRILRGEAASSISPVILGAAAPHYDWRELYRWRINQNRLPPGSIVKFRTPSFWERYRTWIIAGLSALVVQSGLIIGLVLNLRRRRKAERSLRKSEEQAKEAAANAQRLQLELAHMGRVSVLAELSGSMAHELNQPLAAIMANAHAAERLMKEAQSNGEEVRDALKDIVAQGQQAGEIIARLRGMLKREPAPMAKQDLNLAIKEVLQMVHSDLVMRRVTPVLRLDPQLPRVQGDGVQLRQVLLNLVVNARDAMSDVPPARREMTIESQRTTTREVEISISDSGPGFPAEVLTNLFEPFQTTKANGVGLGLVICSSILRRHGGQLTAANNPDKGATLRFTLPAEDEIGA